MASVPLSGPGSQVVQNNMREARQHGTSKNMATASTYYWFYQKVRNHGPWDYKAYDPYWAAFGNFNFGAAGTAAGLSAGFWNQLRQPSVNSNHAHFAIAFPMGPKLLGANV